MIYACRHCWQPLERKEANDTYDAWFCTNLDCPMLDNPQKYEAKTGIVAVRMFKRFRRR